MEKKRICFIGNFYKTIVFEAIARKLSKFEIEVFWILPKRSQYNDLINRYPEEKLLLLDRSFINLRNEPIGDFKLNEIIYGDRVWKYDISNGLKYLINIQRPVYDFIKTNKISIVFGELTWGQEILIFRMCNQIKELECSYFSQMVTRIPNGRFFFFADEKQSKILKISKSTTVFFDSTKIEKPKYLSINNNFIQRKMSFGGILRRMKLFISNEHIEKSDPNVITNRFTRLRVVSKEIINQQMYRFLNRVTFEEIKDRKYILFGFHKQPEASIDVCGRYSEDQFANVLNIWRLLPLGWLLVIKEHSNAIGDRSVGFFKKILKYPNIVLINEYTDSHKLIAAAQLVITNTGTMGLEAALKNVPAITLSKVLFNCLNYCRHYTFSDLENFNSIESVINDIIGSSNNKEAFENLVNNYSFEGILVDVVSNPNVMEDDNIDKLTHAFLKLIEYKNGISQR